MSKLRKPNPYDHITDCILKDVLDGVIATPEDIDHCAMVTMVDAADGDNKAKYDRATVIVKQVMSDKHSFAVKELKEYWYEET